ncbi:MAG: hypothetical protein HZA46_23805 [Planctomycetales bacterium]|nr:hypothetical protein [Planctomycetales bacterium]
MSITEAYPRLVHDLHGIRQQWRSSKLFEGCLRAAAIGLGAVVAVVAADNLFAFSKAGRFALACLLVGTVIAVGLKWVVRRMLEDHRDDFFAALVEDRYPALGNRLINGLQLGRGTDYGSPRLIEAIVSDAVSATSDLDLDDCVDSQPVRQASWLCGGVVALLVIYAIATPRFGNGLSRVLLPFAGIDPYTATLIVEDSIRPGNTRVPEGVAVPIEVRVQGDIPATAKLLRKAADGAWQPTAMQPGDSSPGLFRFTVPQAMRSFDFRIAAGDDSSAVYRVEVVKRPQVEGIAITYTLPPYTGRDPQEVAESDGDVTAIAGTTVEMTVSTSKPLREATLVTDSQRVFALTAGSDGQTWKCAFVVWPSAGTPPFKVEGSKGPRIDAPARYQLRLQDTDGYENLDPLWHSISLAKDLPPTVAIVEPGRDTQVKPNDSVTVKLHAKDDFGVGQVRLIGRLNDEEQVREVASFPVSGQPELQAEHTVAWNLSSLALKSGDVVRYWAEAADRNDLTGPGRSESRRFALFVIVPEKEFAQLDLRLEDIAAQLESLLRQQMKNLADTQSGAVFDKLVDSEIRIRSSTDRLAKVMRRDGTPLHTVVEALEELHSGLMADAVKLLESGREALDRAVGDRRRETSIPVQEKIVAKLKELLDRMQRNEQARKELKKLEKTDKPAFQQITQALGTLTNDLDRLVGEEKDLATKFEKMPKRAVDELSGEKLREAMKDLEDFAEKWGKWREGSVNELTKLPTGFVDDFGLKPDVNRVFEEIEQAVSRAKAAKLEVALEDLGAGLATEMLEDLELWMPDAPDSVSWVQEEPLNNKPMSIPEMPLPNELEDLIGDLMQEAEEFDEEADDITSAWGDNLNQAGWGVSDGPISSFSAKGKTGNDQPNSQEVSGRSGDGRRGKSSGQMVGDTSRGLDGRKTPARVNNERYEPGQLKEEGKQDPNGATGGGKKAGSGKKGLQGGTPPDFQKDMDRLSAKQAGVREKAEKVAERLETQGVTSRRLTDSIQLMKQAEQDLRDLRYDDGSRRSKVALSQMKSALRSPLDQTTAAQLQRARSLPKELRDELLQSADEGYPAGYESLLKSYFRALSEAEK